MKVNREQFLAAALLFAATTGCGKITDKMKESIGAEPAAHEPVSGAGLGIDPNTVNNTPATGGQLTKTNPVNAKQPAVPTPKIASKNAGPSNEGVGPANENVAPSKENFGPSSENRGPSREWGPSNENRGPSREWGPSAENRGRRGPANENWGPANERFPPRPTPTSSGKAPLPPKPKRG